VGGDLRTHDACAQDGGAADKQGIGHIDKPLVCDDGWIR